jgi:phosphohistidine swiveling domain-containing protein
MVNLQECTRPRSVLRADDRANGQTMGGKASALAALHRAQLPIPAWFVVPPTIWHASLSDAQRSAFAAACASSDMATIEQLLACVQISEPLRSEIAREVAALCPDGASVAVRSSALDEDGGRYSFAGQLASYLFVAPEHVLAKIIEVWRSGFCESALAYRHEHGLPIPTELPAVLVQRMVEAEVAGVAFSADPVSGRRAWSVVSALYGLGSALVSGEWDADTYTVARDGRILARTIAEKRYALHHISGNVVEPVPVPVAQVRQPALTDAQIGAVAALARRCARHAGSPQDIEWALADGQIFLLQARPITSLAGMADPDGQYTLWDNSNIAESYNGITTPLTFSFARFAYEQVYRQMCRVLGVPAATIARYADTFRQMIGLIEGRVYYNLLNWYRLLALMPGFTANRTFMETMMGVKEGLPADLAASLDACTWGARLADRIRLLTTLGTLLASYRRLPRAIRRFYQLVEEALAAGSDDLAELRADELVASYRLLERQLIASWHAPLINDLFAMLFYGVLRTLTIRWCGDQNGSLQNDLLSGEGGIISAEPARRVRTMASMAAAHPLLVASLCQDPPERIAQMLDAFAELKHEYQAYLEQFADRCLEELKLESATLYDDPLPLLRSIGYLARQLQAGAAQEAPNADQELRQRAEQRVSEVLRRHPLRRLIFARVVQQARARVRDRENLRFERTRVFGRVRRIFRELGRRFYTLNLLEEPRDIFYLEVEEALGFVTGTATTTDLAGLVSVRKTEYARFQARPAPADRFETYGIVNHGQCLNPTRQTGEAAAEGEMRSGTGCCPGMVRGRVRVVTDPQHTQMQAGDILVARRTDPGWIMLFPAAAGVLIEHGSLLSHSAIVAREMGIPAIVGLDDATHWLCDGEWVEMNGSSGVVRKVREVNHE